PSVAFTTPHIVEYQRINPFLGGGKTGERQPRRARKLRMRAHKFKKRRNPKQCDLSTETANWASVWRKALRQPSLKSQGTSPLAALYPQAAPHRRIGFRLVVAPATRSGAGVARANPKNPVLLPTCRRRLRHATQTQPE